MNFTKLILKILKILTESDWCSQPEMSKIPLMKLNNYTSIFFSSLGDDKLCSLSHVILISLGGRSSLSLRFLSRLLLLFKFALKTMQQGQEKKVDLKAEAEKTDGGVGTGNQNKNLKTLTKEMLYMRLGLY
ncbi:uncharacterized protein LOC9308834 isoform X2 [Arabidopsis lyrata subsp. lyrata]|uniref:uncharacterized protein LOC9308834 isoform X2 n=1 Tax=Arabidopsis lyrata subsp. lyrata TaxID=81972 RepID=UPI000A29A943|nr:uncharacterized protein LOC9308834 isoform X2 [Arabidopsis lyrata subsp. lyrata]|eukprot:XP_020876492.1 uncharacterized protein LOC9308834 isoform X2 [Arabidopsis lyrata subsp. lyrata]